MSDGETPQEAVESVMDAIACWIEAAEEDRVADFRAERR